MPTTRPSTSAERRISLARSGTARMRCSHSAAFETIVGLVAVRTSTTWAASCSGSVSRISTLRRPGRRCGWSYSPCARSHPDDRQRARLGRRRERQCVVARKTARAAGRQGRRERERVDHLFVTGGLGGTPDDITREALAAAYDVAQEVVPELAADLRARFRGDPEYAARWAALPAGARPLENPLGGAPGFRIGNTWVLPGLPSEMQAMFDLYAGELAADRPIETWRRRYATRESTIARALEEAT